MGGPMYRPPWVVGGIHNPTIDPIKHFSTQDRFETVSFREFVKCFCYAMLPARVMIFMVALPIIFVIIVEQRREPLETFMDREEYWKDFDSYFYGVYFDHHHFSHMLSTVVHTNGGMLVWITHLKNMVMVIM